MGRSEHELASRIKIAKPIDPEGRYDWASKVEVKAYFAVEIRMLKDINTANTIAIARLEAQVAELELSVWAKIKRWFSTISQSHGKKQKVVEIKQGESPQLSPEATARVIEAVSKLASKEPTFIGRVS